MSNTSYKSYYEQLKLRINIADIVESLIGKKFGDQASNTIVMDCPRPECGGVKSFKVYREQERWYCFACNSYGDVINLVECLKFGAVTQGKNTFNFQTHRQACDYLAARVGMPLLSTAGMSPEEILRFEQEHAERAKLFKMMNDICSLYHKALKANPEVMKWVKDHYAVVGSIDDLLIGYSEVGPWVDTEGKQHPSIVDELTGEDYGYTREELLSTGFFRSYGSSLNPFFKNRIVFPYRSGGFIVYAIGRRTPWTPQDEYENAVHSKYKKLPLHSSDKHPLVSRFVKNVLFNEQILNRNLDYVVITEGITDCLALLERNIPSISPVTVRFCKTDRPRILEALKRVKTVYICLDNERSGYGANAAREMAEWLEESGHTVRIIHLPLGPEHIEARKQLEEKFKVTPAMEYEDVREIKKVLTPEQLSEFEDLDGRSKLDVNDYFLAGHRTDEFRALMAKAQSPIEIAIDELGTSKGSPDYEKRLNDSLQKISACSPVKRENLLKKLVVVSGLRLKTLQDQMKVLAQDNSAAEPKAIPPTSDASFDLPCLEFIKRIRGEKGKDNVDAVELADRSIGWLIHHGAIFYKKSTTHDPMMFFKNELYHLKSTGGLHKNKYQSFMFAMTEIPTISLFGKTFYEAIALRAMSNGATRETSTWIHTDKGKFTIYFALNNAKNEIVKIDPSGVTVMANGSNEHAVILEPSEKMLPIEYQPDVDPTHAFQLIDELVVSNLACPRPEAEFIALWLVALFLLEFAGTRPMLRFEGNAESGKTSASKIISNLLFGQPAEKTATTASNYTDSAQSPLLCIDNLETKQVNDGLKNFFLTAVMGNSKEKRRYGTDSEIVREKSKCLILSTGIEPLVADLSEISSRTIKVNFDRTLHGKKGFIEVSTLDTILAHRNEILSGMFKRISEVLGMLRDGAMKRVVIGLEEKIPSHELKRANDYLALMYLLKIKGMSASEGEERLEDIDQGFCDVLERLSINNRQNLTESNSIANALSLMFRQLDLSQEGENGAPSVSPKSKQDLADSIMLNGLQRELGIKFHSRNEIRSISPNALWSACTKISTKFGLPFEFKTATQFGQRMHNDLKAIREHGFEIEKFKLRKGHNAYNVTRINSPEFEEEAESITDKQLDLVLPWEAEVSPMKGEMNTVTR